MLFGRELDESVFDLLPKKHKVGGGLCNSSHGLQTLHHGQNFTSHFTVILNKKLFQYLTTSVL
jgi:hypothetical protein